MQQLLEEFAPRVYRFALRLSGNRHTAEDIAQEALLRAWRARGSLRNEQKSRVWLLRITVNVWRDGQRRRMRGGTREESLQSEPTTPQPGPVKLLVGVEDAQRALAALDELPPRQREVLYLHACEELSIAEIAQVLDIGSSAVKASLCEARKRMRERLADLLDDVAGTRPVTNE